MSSIAKIDTPAKFFAAIPLDPRENLIWRQEKIWQGMAQDVEAQKILQELILADPKIFFNAVAFTLNPQKPPGERNQPFILRPKQELVVDELVKAINTGHDMGIEKSRKEGATELCCKLFTILAILVPMTQFLVGSRKEHLVDRTGDQYTIFAKIDHVLKSLPPWWQVPVERTHLHLRFLANESGIDGETTNENFGAGGRATAVMLDEFGRVDRNVAESIEGSVHDVANSIIYSSTHWLGSNHPFNKALRKPSTKVVTLPWYENPEKRPGLYKSPDIDVIEIVDIDYYRRRCPDVFNEVRPNVPFKYSDWERELLTRDSTVHEKMAGIRFIADGCENIPGDLRSPWHDVEEERRRGNKRDFISNVWMSPIGASDMVFDDVTLNRIKETSVCEPDFTGEIIFNYGPNGRVIGEKFRADAGRKRFQWWGELINGRPNQEHNYIVGCDPSLGTGNSNSVAVVYDVNTHDACGVWACSNTPYERFADTVVALGRWAGGRTGQAFVVYENNGGHGINFGRRLVWNEYGFLYSAKTEGAYKHRRRMNKWGWHSNRESKGDLLGELGIALYEGLKTKPMYRAIRVHDADTVEELYDYLYLESGEIAASKSADLTSGAREKHGDRVVATALCVLGSKDQYVAAVKEMRRLAKPGSMAWRLKEYRRNKEKKEGNNPFLR